MPIKGLTEREAAFPQIGTLRKGAAKTDEKRPGADLTWFRFTSDTPEAVASFTAAYGDKPADINIVLPYATTDENLSAWREEWVAGGLVHRCDGETAVLWRDKDGTYKTGGKPCPGGCKAVGRLSVIVPELKRLAFVTVLTTSLHDVMTLTENLRALEMLKGDLRGIPLILRRRPRKVSVPEIHPKGHPQAGKPTGRRVRREKWLLTIEAAPQWVALQLQAQAVAALPLLPGGSLPELSAPEDENGVTVDGATGEIISTVAPWTEEPWDDEESEPEPAKAPAPEPPAQPHDPMNPSRLLQTLNEKVPGYYQVVNHVINAVRIESGNPDLQWPESTDIEAWRKFYQLALSHAKKAEK